MRETAREWITHHGYQLWAGVCLLQAGLTTIDVIVARMPWQVWQPLNVFVLVLVLLDRRLHNPVQCLLCLPEQQRGAELSLQWRHSLQTYHWIRLRRATMLTSLLALAVLFFVAQATRDGLFAAAMRLATAAILGFLAGSTIAAGRHERVSQWCPWCRRDDGDDDEDVVPPPVPVATASRD